VDDGGREEVAGARGALVPPALAARVYDRARAARWALSPDTFAETLDRSARHAFAGATPAPSAVERYVESLHLEDLALATACAAGIDAAWEHFIQEHRPALYRAAAAIDRAGGGRELADSLYADLFGLRERDGERQSLFRYFHGRSSLGSWARAVLAQRHIDRVRALRRLDPLPDDDAPGALPAVPSTAGAGASAYHVAMHAALAAALAALAPRERLRLACYYARNMKLAAIGRMLGEHEASVSRHLARARRDIRASIEAHLRTVAGYDEATITECFRTVAGDSGALDLGVMFDTGTAGKNPAPDRS
jgi:RNA polymerase sigma-70 factor (ECF subfamily)